MSSTPMTRWVDEHGRSRRRIAPWLAPIVVGVLYYAELAWEAAFAEPATAVVHLSFAVPLVLSATVLLRVVEQEVRGGTVTPRVRMWLTWTPARCRWCSWLSRRCSRFTS
jgi:hypothetical protein